MTREEARIELQDMKDTFEEYEPGGSRGQMALKVALTALRPVSREQVRRGTIIETIKDGRMNRVFSCCGRDFTELTCWYMPDFCPNCGAPMTDEAVEMMMERLEEICK